MKRTGVICGVMIMALLAGCGKNATVTTTGNDEAQAVVEASEAHVAEAEAAEAEAQSDEAAEAEVSDPLSDTPLKELCADYFT